MSSIIELEKKTSVSSVTQDGRNMKRAGTAQGRRVPFLQMINTFFFLFFFFFYLMNNLRMDST